jgi:hypothetical protein
LKKWVPVKGKMVVIKKNAEPYIEKVSTRSMEFYKSSKDAVTPHIVKVKEFAHPYYQVLFALFFSKSVQLQPFFEGSSLGITVILCFIIAIWSY